MKILLTGIAGFIASSMAELLLEKGYDVMGVDALIEGSCWNNVIVDWPRRSFWKTRVEDLTLENMKDYGYPDAILHFAALSNNDTAIKDPRAFESNISATSNICKIASELKIPAICIGTDEEYGPWASMYGGHYNLDIGGFKERDRLNPTSMYAASKASSALCALSYFKTFQADIRISRGANTYGIRQQDKLIPTILKNKFQGLPVPIFKTPASRCWIHVRDHCKAVLAILEHGKAGEIYNISGDEHYSPLEVAQMFVPPACIEFVEDRMGYDLRYFCNDSKIRTELGWKPEYTLKESVPDLEEWYYEAYFTGYFD